MINSKQLTVMIADDSNDKEQAQKVTNELTNFGGDVPEEKIYGVVGHYYSGINQAIIGIYENGKLVPFKPI